MKINVGIVNELSSSRFPCGIRIGSRVRSFKLTIATCEGV